jgi:hypothetical protein
MSYDSVNMQMLVDLVVRLSSYNIEKLSGIEESLTLLHNRLQALELHNEKKIKCAFILHHHTTIDCIVDVYHAMRASGKIIPIVYSINRSFNQFNKDLYYGEEDVHRVLDSIKIPHVRLSMADSYAGLNIVKDAAPDIIFRQSPWEIDIPPAFRINQLSFARLCYIPYGFFILENDKNGGKYDVDQDFHRAAWKIFCPTEAHRRIFDQESVLKGENVVVTGYPKFDKLLRDGKKAYWPINNPQSKLKVVWGAHHSVNEDWNNFGLFLKIKQKMLKFARENINIDIVFKPHPMLIESCCHGLISWAELTGFLNDWMALPNAFIHNDGNYGSLFSASDVMISDGLSFLSEYQLFDKPIIFLERFGHSKFNVVGEMLKKGLYCTDNINIAFKWLLEGSLIANDELKVVRRENVNAMMPTQTSAAKKIVDSIVEFYHEI